MRLLLLIILVPQPVYALKVDHITDKATGFSAIAVFIPSGENSGFSVIDVPEKLKKDTVSSHGMTQGSQREPASLGTEGEQRAIAIRRLRMATLKMWTAGASAGSRVSRIRLS